MNLSKLTQDLSLKVVYSVIFLILVGLSLNYYLNTLHNYLMTVNNGVQIEFMIYTFLFLIGSLGVYVLFLQDKTVEETKDSSQTSTKEVLILELVKGVVVGYLKSKNAQASQPKIRPFNQSLNSNIDDEIGFHT